MIETNACAGCKCYERATLFELCKHATSEYRIENKIDHHTIQHMTQRGPCGADRKLFKPK